MSSNWIDQMSQEMELHEVEAPKGLWEGIEQGMGARKRERRAKLVWAWRAGAAAAVVAGVVVGVQMWDAPGEGGTAQVAQTEQPKTEAPRLLHEENAPAEQSVATAQQKIPTAHNEVVPVRKEVVPVRQNMTTQRPIAAAPSTHEMLVALPAIDAPGAGDTLVNTPAPVVLKRDAPLMAETKTEDTEDVYIVSVSREQKGGGVVLKTKQTKHSSGRTKHHVSLQLMAMATGEFAKNYDGAYMEDTGIEQRNPADSVRMESQHRAQFIGPARAHRGVNTKPLYGEHDFPVKVGLTLRVPLSQRFALDAGLSYARMCSDLTFFNLADYQENHGTQQVNYLGVPVALTADLWQNRWWSIYASAGGEVAKSVKTTWRTAQGQTFDVTERPWQWGVSAAVGVQLNLTQHVGLYAQPSADYYFDNHSAVKTYYSDHPFTPALRMGVRVKL